MIVNILLGLLVLSSQLLFSWQKKVQDDRPLEIIDVGSELDTKNATTNTTSIAIGTKQLPPPHGAHVCYPPGSNGIAQFIIGYGSLMQTASKNVTLPNTGENIPIRVYGFERSWTCQGHSLGYSTTFLGVDASTNRSAYMNAAFFRMPSAAALHTYDARESFYCREEVLMSRIQLLTNASSVRNTLPSGQYWIYVTRPEYREVPTAEYPIVQSYVDTFLSGCMELEDKFRLPGFAEECVNTTVDWENPWKNDRIFPRRPLFHQPSARRIDRLLNITVHDAFNNIQIEG